MRVCLDAGHGYKKLMATGARGNGLTEDDIARALCGKIAWYLNAAGHHAIQTRPTREFVALKDRGKIAKREHCELFVSIHCNAAGNPAAHGAEVLVVENDKRSKAFGQALLEVLVRDGMTSRGVKWDSQSQHSKLAVLRDTYATMPAALIEVGFLSNAEDAARIRDGRWMENLAAALAKVISEYKATS